MPPSERKKEAPSKKDATKVKVRRIEQIQPVLVGVQLALTALWRSYGVEPDAVIGHSMGGKVALILARDHPDVVERLMVVDVPVPPGLRVVAFASSPNMGST